MRILGGKNKTRRHFTNIIRKGRKKQQQIGSRKEQQKFGLIDGFGHPSVFLKVWNKNRATKKTKVVSTCQTDPSQKRRPEDPLVDKRVVLVINKSFIGERIRLVGCAGRPSDISSRGQRKEEVSKYTHRGQIKKKGHETTEYTGRARAHTNKQTRKGPYDSGKCELWRLASHKRGACRTRWELRDSRRQIARKRFLTEEVVWEQGGPSHPSIRLQMSGRIKTGCL